MPNDAGLGVSVDVGLPLPARRVRVPGPDVLGLEALELLLRAELVGLQKAGQFAYRFGETESEWVETHHFDLCVEGGERGGMAGVQEQNVTGGQLVRPGKVAGGWHAAKKHRLGT